MSKNEDVTTTPWRSHFIFVSLIFKKKRRELRYNTVVEALPSVQEAGVPFLALQTNRHSYIAPVHFTEDAHGCMCGCFCPLTAAASVHPQWLQPLSLVSLGEFSGCFVFVCFHLRMNDISERNFRECSHDSRMAP